MLDRDLMVAVVIATGCRSPTAVEVDATTDGDDGSCAGFDDGVLDVAGTTRTFVVAKPAAWSATRTWPLVFAWHGGASSPMDIVRRLGLDDPVERHGVVVIAPGARDPDALPGWDDLSGEASPDLALYDRLLGCATSRLRVDRTRVYSTGFSGGAFFTYWLGMVRADSLAAIAPFSGSLRPRWTPPTHRPTALITWGGPTDQSLAASPAGTLQVWSYDPEAHIQIERLRANGQPVVACEHSGGHAVPPEAAEYLVPFLLGDARLLPEYCAPSP